MPYCPVCVDEYVHLDEDCPRGIPRRFWARLDVIAKANGLSRYALVARILEHGLGIYENDQASNTWGQPRALARTHTHEKEA
jgi:hypothetical protein